MEIRNSVFFSVPNSGLGVPEWLNDADEMNRQAGLARDYFDTCPDPVLGMYSIELNFRVVHRLGAETYFNSDITYSPPCPEEGLPGDVVSLGKSRNMRDGQTSFMMARVLKAVATPAEYAHYLVYRHTFLILVE